MSKALLLVLAALVAALAIAACGGGDSSSSSSTTANAGGGEETPVSEEEGDGGEEEGGEASEDAKLGEEDAEAKVVAKPQIKAGILNLGRVSESGARSEDVMLEALDAMGWSHVSCDAEGNPAKMATCGESLLNQGAEAIFMIAIPPEAVQPTLKRAQTEGVPVISYAGGNPPSPLMAGEYNAEEELEGELAAEYLIEKLKEEGAEGEQQIALFTTFLTFGAERQKGFEKAIAAEPEIKIVEEKEVDPANSVGSGEKETPVLLNQYPDLAAIVAMYDDVIAGAARSVQKLKPNSQFPERPLLISFDAIKSNQPWIARGIVDAVVDADYTAPAWAVVDVTANYFARQTPIPKTNPEYNGVKLLEPQVITKENLPPEGQYVPPPFDLEAFFGAKWETEYK
jgi:ABC-type sugar transport system substrate-binding protein